LGHRPCNPLCHTVVPCKSADFPPGRSNLLFVSPNVMAKRPNCLIILHWRVLLKSSWQERQLTSENTEQNPSLHIGMHMPNLRLASDVDQFRGSRRLVPRRLAPR
jgi:hypothetical protein